METTSPNLFIPGHSGAAVVDSQNRLIGMYSAAMENPREYIGVVITTDNMLDCLKLIDPNVILK